MEQLNILGWIETASGRVPRIGTSLQAADRWGELEARWGVNRMDYRIEPGLYAVGSPGPMSQVLVTANYKLTFDKLRARLGGLDAWIMVLDTRGINVWCAAGKGTFGTEEVVRRIKSTGLAHVVSHRRLVLPQLGAPGVAAHEVKRRSGFTVVFGPVRAMDIEAFLRAGMKATPEMRRVTFGLLERLVLVPLELMQGLKFLGAAVGVFLALSGLERGGYSMDALRLAGPVALVNLLLAYMVGTISFPVFLPWLPGRAFAFKGFMLGLAAVGASLSAGWMGGSVLERIAWALILPAAVSFIAMNFTGSTPITSLSGVRREMRIAVPLQIGAAVAGTILWTAARLS